MLKYCGRIDGRVVLCPECIVCSVAMGLIKSDPSHSCQEQSQFCK